MPLDGPIAAAAAAANDFAWAHYFFWQVIPMPLNGPIAFAASALKSGPVRFFSIFGKN